MDAQPGCTTFRQRLLECSDIPLRAALAATFITAGYGKFFGGVPGFAGHLEHMGVPLPTVSAWLAATAEFWGGIAMVLGLLTRVAALGQVVVMLVAIFGVHFSQGFQHHAEIVNGKAMGMGYAYQFTLLCCALTLALRGAGPLSIDALIRKRCCRKKEADAPAA